MEALHLAAAALPVVVLSYLVVGRGWGLVHAGWLSAGVALAVVIGVAGLGLRGVAVALGKGAWTGLWILLIVVPALLLFELAQRGGSIRRMSQQLGSLAGTRPRQLLLFAWVVPSFVQGVAGFGVPIVVAAPMLVQAGIPPAAAVAAVLVGYHWSVTFGSMGSSFFVAAGTAGLSQPATARFALLAASVLALNAALAGLLVLRRSGRGAREALVPAALTAVTMGGVLIGVAAVQPALGSTAAGLAGLVVLLAVLRRQGGAIALRPLLLAAAPYLGLTGLVLTALAIPPIRAVLSRAPVLAPGFPGTTSRFADIAPVAAHQPLQLLQHPWIYVLIACAATWLLYRRIGWLGAGDGVQVLKAWAPKARRTALSLLGLTVLAAVMVQGGLIALLADALVGAVGVGFAVLSPVLGALGTALAGSTTASNALLAPLQAGAADRLGVDAAAMLTGQTAGGNVGNALTPMNVAVAAAAVGVTGQEGLIIKDAAKDAVPLLLVCAVSTVLLVTLW